MKTTIEQLYLFFKFLKTTGKRQEFFDRFEKAGHPKLFAYWAFERPAKNLIVSAFGWPNDEIDEWYELDKKWQKFLEAGESSPQPEKLSPTPRETCETGVLDEYLRLFRAFLRQNKANEDYFHNFGYGNPHEGLWEEWAKNTPINQWVSSAFTWRANGIRNSNEFWKELYEKWNEYLNIETYPLSKTGEIKPGMVVIDKATGERRTILHVSKIFVILTDIILKETVTTVKMFEAEYYLPSFTPYQLTEFLAEKPFERKIRSPKTGEEYKVVSVGRDGVGLEEFMVMIGWEDLVNYEWADTKQPVGKAIYNQLSNN